MNPQMRKLILATALLCAAQDGQAAGLTVLINEAVDTDPAVLEARASEEVAASRAAATRAQHLPTLGAQAGGYLAKPDSYSQPFRGVAGRVNLYAAGSIDTAIEREELKQQSLRQRTAETRELVAATVAQLYMEALRANGKTLFGRARDEQELVSAASD